ncbi:SGNH/GDSL hydrolase family protein [Lysinibacillus piscis]|uniref:Lipase n=1 Tax=Lysinibacillus piscis TaxID=2518931 RepID=A0ABQ5NMK7_9BACI|nr:SGNH/GDSL hydrolase family protein [Lysinibacillus sp. KH24]GLC89580.1 lipase [Lysinibacillus sp. KH24]
MTKILFIGDSITEWGRHDENPIGSGYVYYVSEELQKEGFHVINKGVGGNRITDLLNRWKEDVLSEQPDIVSISIGINDVWRQIDHPEKEQVDILMFCSIYERLLSQTNAKFVLMEPTIIGEKIDSVGNQILKAYAKMVGELAKQYNAYHVNLHEVFIEAIKDGKGPFTIDGVHMNDNGNRLIADTWLHIWRSK